MAKARFRVLNLIHNDHVQVIEMDNSLMLPEAGILDYETGTLRSLKNGGQYTLVPIEDHTVSVLKRVSEVYKNITETPAKMFSTHISRIDSLLEVVGLMFGKVEYVLVENREDLQQIIAPSGDYESKKVSYTVMGDLLAKADAEAVQFEPPTNS